MIWPSSGFGWLLSASICAIMRAKAVESCFGLIATRLEHIFECVFMLNKEEPTPQQSRRGHGTAKAGQTLMSFTGAPPKGGRDHRTLRGHVVRRPSSRRRGLWPCCLHARLGLRYCSCGALIRRSPKA